MPPLILGSRGSALALAQAGLVRQALRELHPGLEIELKIITTSGDRRQDVGAGEGSAAGLKGLFTKEIQEALLDRSIHAAVHSLKDLPGITPPGLGLAAVLPRADPSDMLISRAASLPDRARVGTGSVRRRREIEWLRPGVEVVEIRGNVPTRLQKLAGSEFDAIVLARAGLDRLGYTITDRTLRCDAGTFHAEPLDILPAIGQGAIGIETRLDDSGARAVLAAVDHPPTHSCIRVERELLRLLEGDCRLPVGARVTLENPETFDARAIVFREGDARPRRAAARGPASEPEALARNLFDKLNYYGPGLILSH